MIFHLTSRKPVLVAGNGVRSAQAQDLLRRFAEKTDIPVLTTMNAVDLAQGEGRLGFIGVYGNRAANLIAASSDLVIAVGARLGIRQTGNIREYFAPRAELIRADIDPDELSRSIKDNEEKYLADAREFLEKLMSEDIPRYTAWKERCLQVRDRLAGFDREAGNRCIETISSLLPADPVVAVDVGQNQCWSAQSFVLKGTKGRLLIGGGYGSMGCGLPYAIGACIATGRRAVYCVTGDGGLQMNIQELQAVAGERLPVKVLVLNNHALGKISEIQESAYGSRYAQTTKESGYMAPDFKKVAESYGIKAVTLASHEELGAYQEWLTDAEPCLIDIGLPENSKLIPKVNWNSREILPRIDGAVMEQIRKLLE